MWHISHQPVDLPHLVILPLQNFFLKGSDFKQASRSIYISRYLIVLPLFLRLFFDRTHPQGASNMSRHPTLKWAQRDDLVYITIDLPDAKNVNLKLSPEGKFYFSATSGPDNTPYEIDINLYDNVNVDESKANVGSRNVVYIVKKEESKWWNRLLKQEGRTPAFVKVDWNKWVDEDEQDEKAGPDMDYDDVNFSSLNLGGGGGEDFDDDEEEDESDTEEDVEEEIESSKQETKA
ncbi:hypothetical protein LXL04_031205 [Taraxacum kok-saghyz]